MGVRTTGRQAAAQMLFALDFVADEATSVDIDAAIHSFWREFDADPEGRTFADDIVRGTLASLARVDEVIRLSSTNWRLERMSTVDRNVLRMATYELLEKDTIPRAVIIDEAVELAKLFGSADSSAFVNGVLDRVAEELGRIDTDR